MGEIDKVRANQFDAWVGEIQTKKSIELGVGESLLDIGCGIGQFTPMFCERYSEVVGLDPSHEALELARQADNKAIYIEGWGETFEFDHKFDTINMTNLLEHVKDPVKLLKNCKKHLSKDGRIIAQVPNANSVARRLGVIMGIIDSINNISDKERDFYGHKRVYTLDTLKKDFKKAGLKVIEAGGLLYKPLPNEMLFDLYEKRGEEWKDSFIRALVEFGKDKPEDCAQIYICAR